MQPQAAGDSGLPVDPTRCCPCRQDLRCRQHPVSEDSSRRRNNWLAVCGKEGSRYLPRGALTSQHAWMQRCSERHASRVIVRQVQDQAPLLHAPPKQRRLNQPPRQDRQRQSARRNRRRRPGGGGKGHPSPRVPIEHKVWVPAVVVAAVAAVPPPEKVLVCDVVPAIPAPGSSG
jgi:hypothetical protein